MTFDVLGRMITRTDDVSATWTYDVLPGQTNCATYKSCGKLVRAATVTGTAALDYHQDFTFDALGRPDTTTRYLDVVYTSKVIYDAWGRVASEQHQRGSGTAKAYDRRYNAWGQLARIERNGKAIWTATAQDAAGRVTDAALGNGLALVSIFNGNTGRLTDGTVKAAGTQRLHEGYQYDKLGNVSQRLQEWGSTSFMETFDYDSLNRLKWSEILGYGRQSFTYDDIGNIKSKTGVGTGEYAYLTGSVTQPHAVSNIPGIGDFRYDANGNMISGAGRTITWTSFDMPLTISNATGVSSTFYYGANHERVKQTRSDNKTIWYAGAMEVEENGSAVTVKTYLPNGLGVEIDKDGVTKLYYTHHDRLGSVMALSDEAGTLSEQLAYDAWGKRRSQATPAIPDSIDGKLDNKGFTGHEMLDALELVHMNGRVYDPLVARFMSADPLIQEPEHSQSYNRYSYVWNNPTNMTDPTGFQAQQPSSYTDSQGNCDKRCRQLNDDLEREASRGNPFVSTSRSRDDSGGGGKTGLTNTPGKGFWDPKYDPNAYPGSPYVDIAKGVWGSFMSLGDMMRGGTSALVGVMTGDQQQVNNSVAEMKEAIPGTVAAVVIVIGKRPSKPDPWRRVPLSVQDQMALSAAQGGAGQKIISNLGDPKFKGMEKWEYKVKSQQGKDSVVHYVRDPETGKLMDFKFKKSSTDTPSGKWEKTPEPSAGPGTAPSWWPF